MMKESKIVYFNQPGNSNLDSVIDLVIEKIKNENIRNVVIFAARMNSVRKFYNLTKDLDINIIIATYAATKTFKNFTEEKEYSIVPEVATSKCKTEIENLGMKYVQGCLPLEPILSCTGDNSMEMILSTLGLLSNGLPHCINAAIMAYENGYVPQEKIISFSGDTAIIATPSLRTDLFNDQFKIHEIICKPE